MFKRRVGRIGPDDRTIGSKSAAEASPLPAPSPSDALRADSYADLLKPIPNAEGILQALDDQAPAAEHTHGE